MRLCKAVVTCERTATVWYAGKAHCSLHANLLGDRPAAELREVAASLPEARSQQGDGAPVGFPSPGIVLPASLPSTEELEALLAEDWSGGPGFVEVS